MLTFSRFAPAVPLLVLTLASCASNTPTQTAATAAAPSTAPAAVVQPAEEPAATRPMRPGMVPIAARGLSCASAIPLAVSSEAEATAKENAWIAENYPGATKVSQSRIVCKEKTVDQIQLDTANGRSISLFFDASGLTAKAK